MAVIVLSSAGRHALEGIVARPQDGRPYRRAQALLWLAAGEKATAVAQRLRVHRATIHAWATHDRARRPQRVPARLMDRARAGRPRRLAERVEQVLARPGPVIWRRNVVRANQAGWQTRGSWTYRIGSEHVPFLRRQW
jgi:transposase